MRITILLLIFAAQLIAQPNPVKEGEQHVRQFSKVDFEYQVLSDKSHDWFVLFQSPNCGHCQKFKPTFYKLAFDNLEWSTKFAEVNCKDESDLCKMIRIKAYPTLYFFKNNRMYKFEGPRSEESVNMFIREGHSKVKADEIPTRPPTFFEEVTAMFSEMAQEIVYIYTSDHWVLKICITIFLLVVFGLVAATLYFIYDIFKPAKVPRVIPKPKND